jgi:hypothetical protein
MTIKFTKLKTLDAWIAAFHCYPIDAHAPEDLARFRDYFRNAASRPENAHLQHVLRNMAEDAAAGVRDYLLKTGQTALLFEDNGGGLTMCVLDRDGNCVRAATGLEFIPAGQMEDDFQGALIEDMIGWTSTVDDPEQVYEECCSYNVPVVAEADHDGVRVYSERMGQAARRYAGL